MARVALQEGASVLDLRLQVEQPISLRASFAFVADLGGYSLGPEWIRTAGRSQARSVSNT